MGGRIGDDGGGGHGGAEAVCLEMEQRAAATSSSYRGRVLPLTSQLQDDHQNQNKHDTRIIPIPTTTTTPPPPPPPPNSSASLDDWLPITQSKNGNSLTAAFHLLCSGLGVQTLALPLAFISLHWIWGIVCLVLVFGWQLYTAWLLVLLHQPPHSPPSSSGVPGPRYSRYVVLSIVAFGPKLGKLLAIFPTMYLSGGACVLFIITGGGTMELLSKLLSGDQYHPQRLTGAEWFLVFACIAILVSQFFPTLHSLTPVSVLGSVSAFLYFTFLWLLSIVTTTTTTSASTGPPPLRAPGIIDAIGIIALAFRGHNLILEIQGTMPATNPRRPPRNLMWKGVIGSYALIALCIFPLAIAGYWSFGNTMGKDGNILNAIAQRSKNSPSKHKGILVTIYLTMLVHLICAYQLYSMPFSDNLERMYVSRKNEGCPRWVGSAIRLIFGGVAYFIAVALPFLGSLVPFMGAITLPLTLAYPCFMWVAIHHKQNGSSKLSCRLCLMNVGLGCVGIGLSLLLTVVAFRNLLVYGLDANFFKPTLKLIK